MFAPHTPATCQCATPTLLLWRLHGIEVAKAEYTSKVCVCVCGVYVHAICQLYVSQRAVELPKYVHIYSTHTHTHLAGVPSLGTLRPDIHSSKVGAALAGVLQVRVKHASHGVVEGSCDACFPHTCTHATASAAPTLLLWTSGPRVPRLSKPPRLVCVCVG
jgi:hypothetical protein